MATKHRLTHITTIEVHTCDGVIGVKIDGQFLYFDGDADSTGAELIPLTEDELSKGARGYFDDNA